MSIILLEKVSSLKTFKKSQPIKKDYKTEKSNYKPISIHKMHERLLYD